MPLPDSKQFAGQQSSPSAAGDFNAQAFVIQQMLNRVQTSTLVRIVAVTNAGGVEPVGFVDVQPLVNQLDGDMNAMPHAVVYNLPYFRLQGGTNAIILDPQVGDLGIAVFASRDISSVKANKAQANPGSLRTHDLADGLYIGGLLNGTPVQYMRFYSGGIEVVSPTKIRFAAPIIENDATTSIINSAPVISSTATTSITDTAPIAATVSPIIALTGDIVGTVGGGTGVSTLAGSLSAVGAIHSNTEVTAQTTPLHTHHHVDGGGAGTVASVGDPTP